MSKALQLWLDREEIQNILYALEEINFTDAGGPYTKLQKALSRTKPTQQEYIEEWNRQAKTHLNVPFIGEKHD